MSGFRPGRVRPLRLLSAFLEILRGTEQDLTSGKLPRNILLLAVPMVLEMSMESVFAVCDVFFVGRISADAVTTVGLTESMLTIVYAIAIGLAMATAATVARRFGERRPDEAGRVVGQALILGLLVSVVVAVAGALLAPYLLRVMGASDEVVAIGTPYTRVMLATNAVIMFLFLNNAAFRGAGDASIAMRSLWLANGLNLVLDPCLIFGLGPFPEMGLTGAAVATSVGRGCGVLFQFGCLLWGGGRLRLHLGQLRFAAEVMWRLLKVSANGILQFLVATASWVGLVRITASFGDAAVAGYTIAIRIVLFALLPSWGLSNAAATLVGQNLGARQPERAERAVWLTGLYNMVFLGLVSAFFLLFADELVAVFTSEEAVVEVAESGLRIISLGFVFYAWNMVLVQALNGAGDTASPIWINLLCFWLCQIPLALWLSRGRGLGPSGVFAAVAISYSISAVVAWWVFRRGRWKLREV